MEFMKSPMPANETTLPPERHWLRWDDLSGYFYDGPTLGNGLLGCVLHRQDAGRFDGDPDVLLFCFNRADLSQPIPRGNEGYLHARFAVGRFALKPRGKVASIALELDLAEAILRGTIETSAGTLHLKAWVHATRQVLVIEQSADGGEALAPIDFRPCPAGVTTNRGRPDFEESATYDLHPEAVREERDGITAHRQEIGGGRSFTVGWTERDGASAGSRVFLATLAYSHPERAEAFEARALLDAVRQAPLDKLWHEHTAWWCGHYRRITLSLPDDPEAERYWWLQQYKIGCLMRADLQVLDLLGPWYCHTPWRGIWWNYNTQTMYRHLAAGNRCELGEPLLRTLEDHVEQLHRNAPPNWPADALAIGRASSFDLDSPVTMIGHEEDPSKEGREAGNLLWALHSVWWLLGHAGDEAAMKQRLAPLLKGAIRFFEPLLHENNGGRLHLQTTFSPEYKAAPDCHYDVALLRWGCRTLATITPDDPYAQFCREVDQRLVDYPRDAAGRWAIGRDVPYEGGHRHFSHLMAFWPLRLVDLSEAETLAVVRPSVDFWMASGGLRGWSYAAGAVMRAELGEGAPALDYFRQYLQTLTFPTLYREAGMCLETTFFGLEFVHSALLRSGPGWLQLLPARPPEWTRGSIRGLRGFGGVTVDLTWTDAALTATLTADRPCTAELRLPGSSTRLIQLDAGASLQVGHPFEAPAP